MPRARRGKGTPQESNIETHPHNELIIPQLRIAQWEIQFLHDNMPAPELLQDSIYDWKHILHMLVYASALCNYSLFDMEIVRWAILAHDSGHYHTSIVETQHGLMGAYVAASMMKKAESKIDAGKVVGIIERHNATDDSTSNEESVLRAADRLDLWRLPDFAGIDSTLMEAPGWQKVEKIARQLRTHGGLINE